MDFDSAVTDYSLSSENLDRTIVAATAKRFGDTVEIWSGDGKKLLASGIGAATYALQLPFGETSIRVVSPAAAQGMTPEIYIISITNTPETKEAVFINTEDVNGRSSSIMITAEGLTDFIPVRWQYVKNGIWSELNDWNKDKKNKIVASGSGIIVVQARLFDANGYYMDSNIITITRPHIKGEKLP
jgi:hypothetical protein